MSKEKVTLLIGKDKNKERDETVEKMKMIERPRNQNAKKSNDY